MINRWENCPKFDQQLLNQLIYLHEYDHVRDSVVDKEKIKVKRKWLKIFFTKLNHKSLEKIYNLINCD